MKTYLIIGEQAGVLDGVQQFQTYDQAIARGNEIAYEFRNDEHGESNWTILEVTETDVTGIGYITSGEYIEGETAA